ncbi:unnamed protein product [Ixodes persulcatus]
MSFTCENTRVMRAIREFSDMFAVERSSDASTEDETAVRHLDFSSNTNGRRSDSLADIKPASVIDAAEVESLKAELLASKAEISRLTLELSQSEPARKVLLVCQAREVDELKESLQVRLLFPEGAITLDVVFNEQHFYQNSAETRDKKPNAKCPPVPCDLTMYRKMSGRSELGGIAGSHHADLLTIVAQSNLESQPKHPVCTASKEELLGSRNSAPCLILFTSKASRFKSKRRCRTRLPNSQKSATARSQKENHVYHADETSRVIVPQILIRKEMERKNSVARFERVSNRSIAAFELRTARRVTKRRKRRSGSGRQGRCQHNTCELTTNLHWSRLRGFSFKISSKVHIPKLLQRVQVLHVNIIENVRFLIAQKNETLRGKVDTMGQELRRANAKLVHLQTQADEQTAFTRRMQRRLLLQGKEREAYRALMDSYQSEAGQQWPAAAAKQIQSLEAVLADYRHSLDQASLKTFCNAQVEKELEDLRNRRQLSSSCRRDTESQTDQVKFENSENGGASGLRIVHLVENPLEVAFRERLESVSRLEEENDRLRARVKVLEEFGCSQDVTAQVQLRLDQDGSLPDRKSLQDQLASAEAKNRRLVAAFRRTSQDFRQGCYLLTGYRVDVVKEGHYKLTHVYANSPDDYLLFQNGESSMNVLETDYLKRLSPLAEEYLAKHDSVPAFLSALTLKLFAQRSSAQAAARQSLPST